MKGFEFKGAGSPEPIVLEQVFAEKPGGGIVADPGFDALAGTAVGINAEGVFEVIKGYRVYAAASSSDPSIKIAKGSGVKNGDALAIGKKSVAVTGVDASNDEYDTVTIAWGADIPAGTVMYEAKSVSASTAAPKLTPVYVLGNTIKGGEGVQAVRLVNGANIRKETANLAPEVVALLKGITLV